MASPSARKLVASSGLLAICLAGCTSLDPRDDFERTRVLIRERIGAPAVYSPADEQLVQDKVAALLADGLTVEEAVQVALLNNRALQSAFQDIAVARADYVQSGLLTNPTVSLGILMPEGGGRSDLVVSFAQELVDLWQIPIRRKIARAQLEQAVLNIARQAITTAADVRARCAAVLAARELLRLADENVALSRSMMEWAKARGAVTKTMDLDVTLVQANVLTAESARVTVERDLELAGVELARTLGLSRWPAAWELRGELPESELTMPGDDALLATALEQRLDARAAALQAGAAWDEVRRQYLSIFPSITVGPSFERMESRSLPDRDIPADTARASIAAGRLAAPGIATRSQRALARRQIIDSKFGPAIGATLPIWDQNQAQVAKARALSLQRQKDYEDLLDGIAAEVRQAVVNFRAADSLARAHREREIPKARKGLELMRQAYLRGDEDTPTAIAQEQNLIAQQQTYVNALRDRASAQASLEQAIGGQLPVAPSTQPTSRPSTQAESN